MVLHEPLSAFTYLFNTDGFIQQKFAAYLHGASILLDIEDIDVDKTDPGEAEMNKSSHNSLINDTTMRARKEKEVGMPTPGILPGRASDGFSGAEAPEGGDQGEEEKAEPGVQCKMGMALPAFLLGVSWHPDGAITGHVCSRTQQVFVEM